MLADVLLNSFFGSCNHPVLLLKRLVVSAAEHQIRYVRQREIWDKSWQFALSQCFTKASN